MTSNKRTYLKYALHAAILIGLVVAGIKYLNGAEVYQALRQYTYGFAPLILIASLGYVVLKAWRFVLLLRPLDGDLHWSVISKAYVAGQAAALLPGGIAARAGLLKQVHVPLGKGSIPVVFSSGLDQLVLITGALITSLWFERGRTPVLILLGVIGLVSLMLIIPTTRRRLGDMFEWIMQRFDLNQQWQEFLEVLPDVVTWQTMSTTIGLTLVGFAFHIVALDLSIRGLGFSLAYSTLILAYILPTVLGRLSGLPGGVGVTEAGMVGFLTSTSELETGTAAAVVAIFRIAVVVIPAIIGALVYFFGWQGKTEVAPSTTPF